MGSSLRQPSNHSEDAVGDGFEFGVDLGQRSRVLEDVKLAVERDFKAYLGLVMVDPCVGSMGEHFPFEVSFYVFTKRHVLGVSQRGIRYGLAFGLALGSEHDLALRIALRALDSDGAVAEGFVLEDAGDGHAFAGDFL